MTRKEKLRVTIIVIIALVVVGYALYRSWRDSEDPDPSQTVAQQAESKAKSSGSSVPLPSSSDPSSSSGSSAASLYDPEETDCAAPDFVMCDPDGVRVKLSAFAGTPIVINFWASWGDYCADELPLFEKAWEKYGDRVNFVMLDAVKEEKTAADGSDYIEAAGYKFPVYYDVDGNGISQYNITAFPTTIFVGADGYVKSSKIGALTWDELDERLTAIAASAPDKPTATGPAARAKKAEKSSSSILAPAKKSSSSSPSSASPQSSK